MVMQRVPVVGRRDHDRVDVLAVEQPAEVRVARRRRCPPWPRLVDPLVAQLARRRRSRTSGWAWKSSRWRLPMRPMPMNPTRTRSLAPSTRRYEAAVSRPAPAIVFRTVRRGGMRPSGRVRDSGPKARSSPGVGAELDEPPVGLERGLRGVVVTRQAPNSYRGFEVPLLASRRTRRGGRGAPTSCRGLDRS